MESGHTERFGCAVGVDRSAETDPLHSHQADLAVDDHAGGLAPR